MDRNVVGLGALAAALLVPSLAFAQAPPADKSPASPKAEQTDPRACGQGNATVGEGGVDVQKQPGASLSDKLARSNGVICPPAGVDPEIREPTPPGGSMRVIPPPGTPGGNPNVEPK